MSMSFNQDFGSDDEESPENREFASGRDAVVFVIDGIAEMFQEFEEGEVQTTLFTKVLSVLDRWMLNRIISNHKDLVGVVVYNTEHSPEPQGHLTMDNSLLVPSNCAVLVPLVQLEPATIKYVKNLKTSPDFLGWSKFGHSKDAKISDVLWLVSSMLSGCGQKIRVPEIKWFTNDDFPHQPGTSDHQKAFQKAKDLQQVQFDIQFYPLKVGFNGDLFYKELICQLLDSDLDDYPFPEAVLDARVLLQRTFRRGHNKRALVYINVELSENIKFGVGIYSLTRKASAPKPTRHTRDTKEEITAKREYKVARATNIDDDEEEDELDFSEKLEPSMTIKYQECGGEKIKFTPLEAYEIKQISDPKIKILGFKPSDTISEHNHLKSPYFVYPSDKRIKNSSVLFTALWERCLAKNKVIICSLTMRLKSYPKLVALVPQEQEERHGTVTKFDGFRMVFIPFAGDIRDLSAQLSAVKIQSGEEDDDVMMNMKRIVKRLKVNFDISVFENPVVKRIYSAIEQTVYDEEPDTELTEDYTKPNLANQDDRIDLFVDALENLLGGLNDEAVAKRKATNGTTGGDDKRVKLSADDINFDLVLEKCKEGDVKNLTVPYLKGYLEFKKVTGIAKMNKNQLVAKIIELN